MFTENKSRAKWRNHSVVNNVDKACSSRDCLSRQVCLLMLLVKFSEVTVIFSLDDGSLCF